MFIILSDILKYEGNIMKGLRPAGGGGGLHPLYERGGCVADGVCLLKPEAIHRPKKRHLLFVSRMFRVRGGRNPFLPPSSVTKSAGGGLTAHFKYRPEMSYLLFVSRMVLYYINPRSAGVPDLLRKRVSS